MSTQQLSNQARIRLTSGEMILQGFDDDEIIELLDVSLTSLKRWRKLLGDETDLNRLARKHGSGRFQTLTDQQSQKLLDVIKQGAIAAGYPTERWSSKIIADWIEKHFHLSYSPRSVRRWMKEHRLSYQKPIVRLHKYSDEEVIRFARSEWERLKSEAGQAQCFATTIPLHVVPLINSSDQRKRAVFQEIQPNERSSCAVQRATLPCFTG